MQNSPRILVIEDEADLRQIYSETLKNAGYTVDTSVDGEEGIQAMRTVGYDMVFLDVMLPDMNGPELLKILRDQPAATSNDKVIVLTNVDNDLVKEFCLQEGAAGYLTKTDITPDKLLSSAQQLIQKNAQTRQPDQH